MLWIITTIVIFGAFLYYAFPLAQVYGESMLPTLKEGQILFCTRLFSRKIFRAGDIYIFRTLNEDGGVKFLIKRLDHYIQEGDCTRLYFLGDNPDKSNDSRHFGYVCQRSVEARVIFILWGKGG